MFNLQYKNFTHEARRLTDCHNNQTTNTTEEIIKELSPILDKIFALPISHDKKSSSLDVHPSIDKEYIDENDPDHIVFNLQKHHFQFLMDEKFHVRYDPTDRCYSIRW